MAEIQHITKDNFNEMVIDAKGLVLVDFFATWCGPCKMMGPLVDQLAEEMEGKVKVGKINVDEQPTLASRFDIMSIPTLLVFKSGQAVNQSVGVIPKEGIEALVE